MDQQLTTSQVLFTWPSAPPPTPLGSNDAVEFVKAALDDSTLYKGDVCVTVSLGTNARAAAGDKNDESRDWRGKQRYVGNGSLA